MRVVVMGCGRVGASLADGLSRIGHDVAIIDRDASAFHRLSPEFPGERVLGMGFDRDVLLRAGIEEAGAFAAVSSGDNSNIISARLARETFGVQRVVAETIVVHAASRRVMEKAGLTLVRTFPADWPCPIEGDERGDVEYALDRAEWEQRRRAGRGGPGTAGKVRA